MTQGDRERWDARFRAGEHVSRQPDAFFVAALDTLGCPTKPATALDLACGAGRHALELARRGWITSAWDLSAVALELVRTRACEAAVEIATREIDLAPQTPFAADASFELVVVVDFLERPLFPAFEQLVRRGGHLIYATFAPDWAGAIPSARFRILPSEILRGLKSFTPMAAQHLDGRSGVLARRL